MSDVAPVLFIAFFFLGFLGGDYAGRWNGSREQQQQAIDRGHAEWRIIPGTSKTEFKWKDEE